MEEQGAAGIESKHLKKEGGTLRPPAGIAQSLEKKFPYTPTPGQSVLFRRMQEWFENKKPGKHAFILKGYAGTGKTSFLQSLVQVASKIPVQVQLMAPTGRASKVMSTFTKRLALTIHKRIFRYELTADGVPVLRRQKNSFTNTLFIVDEASMVGNQNEYGTRGILEELVQYVFENPGNRMLIIGDTAQLPPVGTDLSLALKAEEMRLRFGLEVTMHELSDVVRQELDSGILFNATALRETIRGVSAGFCLVTKGFTDIFKMGSNRVFEGIQYAYDKYGVEKTLVLTRTNKQAMHYNRGIRGHILYREEEIESGDWIIIVKNNYSFLEEDSRLGFLANGDQGMVRRVKKTISDYPLRITELEFDLADQEEETISGNAFTDLLYSDLPQLTEEQLKGFNQVLMEEWGQEEKSNKKLWARLRTDPIANSLQIKFGYALTCHKAQGGQWDAVFIDQGFIKEGPLDNEFYRWLYTAITRSRKEVFLIQPDARLLVEQPVKPHSDS